MTAAGKRPLKPEHAGCYQVAIVLQGGDVTVVPDWRPAPYPTPKKPVCIRWVLGGRRLGWRDGGIVMDEPWNSAWGKPELDPTTNQYVLVVEGGPTNKERYKYTAYVTLDGTAVDPIDPEVEYDGDFE